MLGEGPTCLGVALAKPEGEVEKILVPQLPLCNEKL